MFASEVKLVSLSSKDSPKNCFRTQSGGLMHHHHHHNNNPLQKYNHNNNLIGGGRQKKHTSNNYGLYNNRKKYYHQPNHNNNNVAVKNQNLENTNYNNNNNNNHNPISSLVNCLNNKPLHSVNGKKYSPPNSVRYNQQQQHNFHQNYNNSKSQQSGETQSSNNSSCSSISSTSTTSSSVNKPLNSFKSSTSSVVMNSSNSNQNLISLSNNNNSNSVKNKNRERLESGGSSSSIGVDKQTSTSTSNQSSTSAPVSPGPYSLDFLHQVGVQMTAGAVGQQHSLPPHQHHPHHLQVLSQHSNSSAGNRNYSSPSISPLRHHHPSYLSLRHHRPYFNQDSSPMVLNDGTIVSGSSSTSSGSKSNNFEIPILYHHPQHHFPPHRNAGIMNSPIAAESFPPFHHFHHQPAASSQNYQNFLNQQVHNQNSHYHQYNSNGGNNQGNNGNLSRTNSSHMIATHQQKKSWNSWKSKNHHNHHNSSQKNRRNSGDHHSNSSCSSSSSSSSVASNSKNSCKNQNLRTLTYVSTDYVNSRSPTPSPKSVSPIFQGVKRLPQQQSTTSSSSSLHQLDTLAQMQPQNSASFPGEESSNTVGGYESDSSHSSYNTNKQSVCGGGEFPNSGSVSGFGQVASEITSLLNFPTYSDEDIPGNQLHYGSQQNLSYWNSMQQQQSMHNPYAQFTANSGNNSPTMFNNANCGASEEGANDHLLKRGGFNSHRGSFRGRRNIYTNVRSNYVQDLPVPLSYPTPPDRFLARAHLVEIKEPPRELLNGGKWDHLSQNIWNKFLGSQQTEETYKKKMVLWKYLYLIIKKAYPRFGLYLVGSTISGFGADTSDVDMCLVSRTVSNIDPRVEALFNLTLLRDSLSTLGEFEHFNLIEAKVPILRFRDRHNFFEVDLNFNNCVGIKNTHLLYCYSQLDWRLRPLVLITKLWAQFHDINNAKNMTISSYSLVLMVVHFLQYAVQPPILPCLHEMYPEKFQLILKTNDFGYVDMNECIGPYESDNSQTLGELFLQFLEYYSNFDYSQYAISIRTGTVLPIDVCRQAKTIKNDIHQWKELCIEEPFDLTNTARSVYDGETFERVKGVFVTSWKVLQETLDLSSIFNPMLKMSNEVLHSSSTTTITSLSSSKVLPIIKTHSTTTSVTAKSPEEPTSNNFAGQTSDINIL